MAHTLTRQVAALIAIPLDPVEQTIIDILEHPESPSGARLYASSLCDFVLQTLPKIIFRGHPLDIYLALFSKLEPSILIGPASAAAVDRAVSAHMIVTLGLHFNTAEEARTISTRISCTVCDTRLRIRILQSPALWAAADHISLQDIRFAEALQWAGRLPATVRVGCNHSLAPEGGVYLAAVSGNVAALLDALADGGSTEEANDVSVLASTNPCLC